MRLSLRSYHDVIKKLREERGWGSRRICVYLRAGGADFHRQSIESYWAKWRGQLPSAESLGLGEYQEEMVGVKIRKESKKRLRGVKQAMPMVVVPEEEVEIVSLPEVLEVPEVPKIVSGTLETLPRIVKASGLDEEPEWGFREWETWRSSGVAENRDSGTYYISRDKAKGPEDWKDGELGYSGFVGDDGRPCSHRRRAAVLPL
jgi:hypothetical protein